MRGMENSFAYKRLILYGVLVAWNDFTHRSGDQDRLFTISSNEMCPAVDALVTCLEGIVAKSCCRYRPTIYET